MSQHRVAMLTCVLFACVVLPGPRRRRTQFPICMTRTPPLLPSLPPMTLQQDIQVNRLFQNHARNKILIHSIFRTTT